MGSTTITSTPSEAMIVIFNTVGLKHNLTIESVQILLYFKFIFVLSNNTKQKQMRITDLDASIGHLHQNRPVIMYSTSTSQLSKLSQRAELQYKTKLANCVTS